MPALTQLVFSGEVLEGFVRDDVMRALGENLALDDVKLIRLFSGKPIVIKRQVEPADAQRHVESFAKLGARLHIETPAPPNADLPTPAPPPRAPAAPATAAAAAAAPIPAAATAAAADPVAATAAAPDPAAAAAAAPNPAAATAAAPISAAVIAPASVPAAAPSALVGEDEIICPNCGLRQPKRELCRSCATNMPMGIAAQIQAEQEVRAARQAERDAKRGVRPTPAGLDDASAAPPMWGIGLSGRMGRLPFATANTLGWVLIYLLVLFVFKQPSGARMLLFAVAMFAALVVSIRWCVLRLHDFNRSGWWALVMGVPYLNLVVSLLLMFWPGTHEDNDHGEPPRAGNGLFLVLALLALCISVAFTLGTLKALYDADAAKQGDASDASSEVAPGGPRADSTAPRADPGSPVPRADPGSPVPAADTTQARAAFHGEYANAPGQKAFAVSPSGAWGMKTGAASPQDALEGAMANCEASRPPDTPPCKTINLNGQGSRTP